MSDTADPGANTSEAVPMGTLREIIEAAGGPVEIAKASDETITAEAVYKWPKIGIQDRHWWVLMKLCSVTAEQLYAANLAARAPVDASVRSEP